MTSSCTRRTSSTRIGPADARPRLLALTLTLAAITGACGTPASTTAPAPVSGPAAAAPRQRWDLPGATRTTVPAGVKRITPIASLLGPVEGSSFRDSADNVVQTWTRLLDTASPSDGVAGEVAGLDMFDGDRILRARLFLFLPAVPLGPDAFTRLLDVVSEAAPEERTTTRVRGIDGSMYHDRNGTCFLGVDDLHDSGAVMWVVSDSEDGVRAAVDAFRAASLAG